MAPSCMRAPPEAETITSGVRRAMARSMARVIFSPTTLPMLPPMKRGSCAQIWTGRPSSGRRPRSARREAAWPSPWPPAARGRACCPRSPAGPTERRSWSKVSYSPPSSSSLSRATASMRECAPHLAQTFQLASRSFFQMIWRQPSHFCHRPSVRTRRSASLRLGSFWSLGLSRLNQDMPNSPYRG